MLLTNCWLESCAGLSSCPAASSLSAWYLDTVDFLDSVPRATAPAVTVGQNAASGKRARTHGME